MNAITPTAVTLQSFRVEAPAVPWLQLLAMLACSGLVWMIGRKARPV